MSWNNSPKTNTNIIARKIIIRFGILALVMLGLALAAGPVARKFGLIGASDGIAYHQNDDDGYLRH